MRLIPKSAFGQTVMLIGVLLLINQIVSYISVTYYFIQPSYQQINSLLATQVKSVLANDLLVTNQETRDRYFQKTQVQVFDESVPNKMDWRAPYTIAIFLLRLASSSGSLQMCALAPPRRPVTKMRHTLCGYP